jgi:Ni/Co efflux regulator RcnB
MKKLLIAVLFVALTGAASFAQTPAQQTTTKKTEQVHHHKKNTKKTSHPMHKKHKAGTKTKTDSTKAAH